MADFREVDKSHEILVLKRKFGKRYYLSEEAHRAAADLWGVECNAHGVAAITKKEVLVRVGRCRGVIKAAETEKGYWLLGLSGETAIGSFGYAPSVWDAVGFPAYEDARAAAIEKLIAYFRREIASRNSCDSESNKANARRAIEELEAAKTPQLALF